MSGWLVVDRLKGLSLAQFWVNTLRIDSLVVIRNQNWPRPFV